MMLARHLDAQGFAISTAPEGPDFRFESGGRTYWIEAVSPEPMGIPEDYLEWPKPGEFKVGDVPHEEVRRRWISAIKAKADKLQSYLSRGLVGNDDAYIIAVNGCQLGAFPIHHGISGLPYAVEAVYPAGPITLSVDRNTGKFGKPYLGNQWAIKSPAGKPIPTSMFVNNKYKDVSAVMASAAIKPVVARAQQTGRAPATNRSQARYPNLVGTKTNLVMGIREEEFTRGQFQKWRDQHRRQDWKTDSALT
jgi:type I restriction enzyme S subunit